VIIVAIVAALVLARPPQRPNQATTNTTTVSRGDIIASVSGTGTIAADQSLEIAFQTTGTVIEVLVNEGDTVTTGDVLARIDDRELQSQVASAEASLASAVARLDQTRTGNATEQDIAASQASVNNAAANLEKTRQGTTTAADIADAEANLRSAQAKLDALLAGPDSDELASAQTTYDKAVADLEAQRTSLSAAKTKAESDVTQAANTLRDKQDEYSRIYWENRDLARLPGDVPQENLDQEAAALRAVETAEEQLNQKQIAYDQAKSDEITGLQKAEATVREAAEKLKATQAGSDQYDIIQAQASVDQARANLRKLREGPTAAEIAASQATLDQAQANLAKLTESATETDLTIEQASVDQAEQSLEQAKLKLEQAVLKAPFAGLVSAVNIVPGSVVSNATAAFSLLDRDPLHIDLKLSENDVALVALGQEVDLTIDALSGWSVRGTVSYIAPAAETSNGVVTYGVRVNLPDDDPAVKVGMTANLTIIVAQKSGVLLVPNSALLPSGSGRVVQVPGADGQITEVPVEIGLSDGTYTEIISGLNEGDTIIATPTTEQQGPGGLFGGN
jgi:HlyD family secretion protein